jgi:integrase
MPRAKTYTTGGWIDHWLAQVKRKVELSTHTDYTRWTRLYVKPTVGAIPLDTLDADDVDDMMNDLAERGLSPSTVRLARTLLISALDAAVKRKKIPSNEARLTDLPKKTKARINDRLDAEQAKAVLDALSEDRLSALAVVALSLGVRPGELFALKWSAVDLEAKTIRIQAGLKRNADGWYLKGPKTDAGKRTLPLPEFVVTALQAHQDQMIAEDLHGPDSFVFCDTAGEPLKARDVLTWWHKATLRAGVGRRRFYCSRHTAATLMLNNGVALEVVSKILGHSGYAITSDVYAEVQEELQRDAADVMDGVLG